MIPALPPEPPVDVAAPPTQVGAENAVRGRGWRWETTGALFCVGLLGWWVWVTGLNTQSFWQVVLAIILGAGIGFGMSGVRRGCAESRLIAGACLEIHLLVAALSVAYAV
jgi:hypothetical protein